MFKEQGKVDLKHYMLTPCASFKFNTDIKNALWSMELTDKNKNDSIGQRGHKNEP